MAFRRGFKAEANRIALRVRAQMDLSPIAPIDPALVCAHFDIVLLKLSELDCDARRFLGVDQAAFSAVTVVASCAGASSSVQPSSNASRVSRS